MAVPDELRAPLSALLDIAAGLARTGREYDRIAALRVKDARDALQRRLCDHREGYAGHLTMGGTVTTCKGCGAPEP